MDRRAWLRGIGATALGLGFPRATGASGPDDEKGAPTERFRLEMGGLAGTYTVEWDGKVLAYKVKSLDPAKRQEKSVTPTPGRLKAFWKALDGAKVWDWSPRYDNPNVLDGGYWTLSADRAGKSVAARGRNAYPDESDVARPRNEPFPGPTFQGVLKATEDLLGFKIE